MYNNGPTTNILHEDTSLQEQALLGSLPGIEAWMQSLLNQCSSAGVITEDLQAQLNSMNQMVATTMQQVQGLRQHQRQLSPKIVEIENLKKELDALQNNFQQRNRLSTDRVTFIKRKLIEHYKSPQESLVKIDIEDTPRWLRVNELFVNLVIVNAPVQCAQERAGLVASTQYTEKTPEQMEEGQEERPSLNIKTFNTWLHTKPRHVEQDMGIVHDSEGVYSEKQTIQPEDIFSGSGQESAPRQLLLLGRPGVGKSMFCRKYTCDWANRQSLHVPAELLQKEAFAWVFYFRLKEIASNPKLKEENGIDKILYHALLKKWGISESESEAFWLSLLHSPEENVLFFLDGYDEVSGRTDAGISPACQALVSVCHDYASFSHLYSFVTSRPYAAFNHTADRVLENIGFLEDDISRYIYKYFGVNDEEETKEVTLEEHKMSLQEQEVERNRAETDDLIRWLDQRHKVKQICHIPINLELLCNLWKSSRARLMQEDITMSDLYHLMMLKLARRYLRKVFPAQESDILLWDEKIVLEKSQEVLNFLQALAYQGLKEGQLIISSTLFKKTFDQHYQGADKTYIINQWMQADFLNAIGDQSASPFEKDYFFIHLSFQEYLAARHFAMSITNENINEEDKIFIANNKYNPAYQLVWTYVSGIINLQETSSKQALLRYFQILLTPPRDLYGMYELELMVRCAEEAKWPDSPLMDSLLAYLGEWTIQASYFKEGNEGENRSLSYLKQLFLACPLSMAKARYRKHEGLLNFMPHEAEIPTIVKWFHQINLRLFPLSDEFIMRRHLHDDAHPFNPAFCCSSIHDSDSDENSARILPFFFELFCCIWILNIVICYTPFILFSLITGIVPNIAIFFYYSPMYEEKRENIIRFMSKFTLRDYQPTMRLLTLIHHGDRPNRLRFIQTLDPRFFSKEMRSLVYNKVYEKWLVEDIYELKMAYYEKLVSFSKESLNNDELWLMINNGIFFVCSQASLLGVKRKTSSENKKNINKLLSFLKTMEPELPEGDLKDLIDFINNQNHIFTNVIIKSVIKDHFLLYVLNSVFYTQQGIPRRITADDNKAKKILLSFLTENAINASQYSMRYFYQQGLQKYLFSTTALDQFRNDVLEVLAVFVAMKNCSLNRLLVCLYNIFIFALNHNQVAKETLIHYLFKSKEPSKNRLLLFLAFVLKYAKEYTSSDYLLQIEYILSQAQDEVLKTAMLNFNENNTAIKENSAAIKIEEELNKTIQPPRTRTDYSPQIIQKVIKSQTNLTDINIVISILENSWDSGKITHGLEDLNNLTADAQKERAILAMLACLSRQKILSDVFDFGIACLIYVPLGLSAWLSNSLFLLRFTASLICADIFFYNVFSTLNSKLRVGNIDRACYSGPWPILGLTAACFLCFFLCLFVDLCKGPLGKFPDHFLNFMLRGEIFRELSKKFHEDSLFFSLLKHYPSCYRPRIKNLFVDVLREQLSKHNTAIWQISEKEFCWYEGRTLRRFPCDNPAALTRDIQSARLLVKPFDASPSFFSRCWSSKKENIQAEKAVIQPSEAVDIEAYWEKSMQAYSELMLKEFGGTILHATPTNRTFFTAEDDDAHNSSGISLHDTSKVQISSANVQI